MKEIYQAFPFGDDGQWMVQRGTEPYVALFTIPKDGKSIEERAEYYANCLNTGEGPPDGPP